ncbi:BatD family protein, partial [Vibrio vulnificus]
MAMFLTLSSLVLSATTCAQDIEDLQRSNHVELLAWVGQPPKAQETKTLPVFSVNEQVILTIEVATPRWFTAGTRIGHVEIPNVIAKQRNPLATNYTERKDGHTWSRQRWEITLYPQASGRFVVPPIAVSVQVSAPNGENVSGTLYTAPISFDASMPSGLIQPQSAWFSASDVEVEQQWQTSSEPLKVGDAITRTITIRAKDSLSVLLPKLLSNES